MNKKLLSLTVTTLMASSIIISAASCGDLVRPDDPLPPTTNPVALSFWHGFGVEVNGTLGPILSNWRGQNNDTISYETIGGYDNLYDKIMMSVTTRTYPNIAVAYPDHMANYITSYILQPLDAMMNDSQRTYNNLDSSIFIDDYMVENTSLGVYGPGIPELAGQPITYGLPFNKSTEVFTFNKTFFTYASSIDPTIKLPETWDEVLEQGNKINNFMATTEGGLFGKAVYRTLADDSFVVFAYDGSGNLPAGVTPDKYARVFDFKTVTPTNFRPFGWDSTANLFITLLRQYGSTYTAPAKRGESVDISTGTYEFARPNNWDATLSALKMIAKLFQQRVMGLPGPTWTSSYCSDPFKAFQVVASVGSSGGVVNNVFPTSENVIGFGAIPHNNHAVAGLNGKQVISQGTNLVAFRKTADENAAAMDAIKYLTGEGNLEFAMGTGYFPVRKADRLSETYLNFLNTPSADAKANAKREAAKANNEIYLNDALGWTNFVDPGFAGSALIRRNVGFILEGIYKSTDLPAATTDAQYEAIIVKAISATTDSFKQHRPSDSKY